MTPETFNKQEVQQNIEQNIDTPESKINTSNENVNKAEQNLQNTLSRIEETGYTLTEKDKIRLDSIKSLMSMPNIVNGELKMINTNIDNYLKSLDSATNTQVNEAMGNEEKIDTKKEILEHFKNLDLSSSVIYSIKIALNRMDGKYDLTQLKSFNKEDLKEYGIKFGADEYKVEKEFINYIEGNGGVETRIARNERRQAQEAEQRLAERRASEENQRKAEAKFREENGFNANGHMKTKSN